MSRPTPTWLIEEPYSDADFGVIRSGKEAQVNLVERSSVSDPTSTCLLVRKRYLPREVKAKGQLEQMGVQRASSFVNDAQYREGQRFRRSRDRRAVARKSARGRELMQGHWTGREFDVMKRVWDAGMAVPYPIAYDDSLFDLEYIGDRTQAAPQLQAARLDQDQLGQAFDQLRTGLRQLTSLGLVHGDLSAYNLLWWDDRLVFIDFPQAIDIAINLSAFDLLHRDVVNVCTWFERKGLAVDAEAEFADLLAYV